MQRQPRWTNIKIPAARAICWPVKIRVRATTPPLAPGTPPIFPASLDFLADWLMARRPAPAADPCFARPLRARRTGAFAASRTRGKRNEAPWLRRSPARLLRAGQWQATPANELCFHIAAFRSRGRRFVRSARVLARDAWSGTGICPGGRGGDVRCGVGLVLRCQPAVAFVDVCLPDRSGFEVVKCIRQLAPGCAAIVLSNAPDPCVEEVARMLGAKDVWHKGNDLTNCARHSAG